METLQFDLNELVSKQVSQQIASLEKNNQSLTDANILLHGQIQELKSRVLNAELPLAFLDNLQKAFNEITDSPKDGEWYNRKNQNQFLFIENIMSTIFNVKKENNGWLSSRGDGNLYTYLAVNYYQSKHVLLSFLPMLSNGEKHLKGLSFIRGFKMPYDWSKDEIISFIQSPGSCTNSSYIGISEFWVEAGSGRRNCPYNLALMSPYLMEQDVWDIFITQIERGLFDSNYFYSIYLYHKLEDNKIKQLGDILIKHIPQNRYIAQSEIIKKFIKDNLTRLSESALSFFSDSISDSNQFNTFHWENFPVSYQHKYLLSKNVEDILKILTGYSCKWSLEEKEQFLKAYFSK